MSKTSRISFTVLSLACIACSFIFERELRKIPGIIAVKPLVMLNAINVDINSDITTPAQVKNEILSIAAKTGLREKIVFRSIV